MPRSSSKRTAITAATMAVTALGLTAGVVAAPAAHATPNVCGGVISDYTGLLALDTAFTGFASKDSVNEAMTVSPVIFGVNSFKTEINDGVTDDESASGSFLLLTQTNGRGVISFPTSWGMAYGTEIECGIGTRVTKISGRMPASKATFAVSR